MTISLMTRKMLWGRSVGRCSHPDCRRSLVEDKTETDDPSIVGDEAHIVARKNDGPRGESDLSLEERDRFANLILLCKIHHKLVDDQPCKYTVKSLQEMKAQHLEWANALLGFDAARQKDDEVYASYVDCWLDMADVPGWEQWSSFVLGGGQPSISVSQMKQLDNLNKYLLSRVWPRRYPDFESAFLNFCRVLNDFRLVFMMHAVKEGDGEDSMYWTKKFYKSDFYDSETYHKLVRKFNYHVDLVCDLMLELTRAANHICDQVRQYLSASFRLEEGVVLVMTGPPMNLTFETLRTEYRGTGDEDCSYPGLRRFMEVRSERDSNFGEGVSESYFSPFEME